MTEKRMKELENKILVLEQTVTSLVGKIYGIETSAKSQLTQSINNLQAQIYLKKDK